MKKLFLLLATGLVATASNGQQAAKSVVFGQSYQPKTASSKHMDLSKHKGVNSRATATTTAATSGWFDYVDTVLAANIATTGSGSDAVALNQMYFWPDTTAVFGYDDAGTTGAIGYGVPSYGYSYNTTTGTSFDPFASDWMTGGSGVSRPAVGATNAYIIDSVLIVATYGRQTGATYTDHLNLSFVYGDGTNTSNMPMYYFRLSGTGSTLAAAYGLTATGDSALWFPDISWDSLSNEATTYASGAPAPVTYTEALTEADTSVALLGSYQYAVNVPVPAGNFSAMTMSFVSGDPSYTIGAGDSITSQDGSTYYHGAFMPIVAFNASGGTTAEYPPYEGTQPYWGTSGDYTTGYFKTEGSTDGNGWSPFYVPNWAYSSTAGGAYYLQMPYVMFHISCPTCTTGGGTTATPVVKSAENDVKVYPNPSVNVINVAFTLTTVSDVNVTLTNMVGQVVATQKVASVSTGNVQFSTSTLADGMYFYTLNANGYTNTGRIVVAH